MSPVLVVGVAGHDPFFLEQRVIQAGYSCRTVDTPEELRHLNGSIPAPTLIVDYSAGAESNVAAGFARFSAIYPDCPVIIITDPPGDAATKKAIELGVAGCLATDRLESDLKATLQSVIPAGSSNARSADVEDGWAMSYTIDNNPELLPLIVNEIRRRIADWQFRDPIDLVRITVALSESLDNALYHGNLELSSDLRQGDGRAWRDESLRRRYVTPYSDRRIRIRGRIDRDAARFTIRDEGPGFDSRQLRDCTETSNLELCSGRGLLLMRMYMDEVTYNAIGNEVTLVKRRPPVS